jgi:hypothetical protein
MLHLKILLLAEKFLPKGTVRLFTSDFSQLDSSQAPYSVSEGFSEIWEEDILRQFLLALSYRL